MPVAANTPVLACAGDGCNHNVSVMLHVLCISRELSFATCCHTGPVKTQAVVEPRRFRTVSTAALLIATDQFLDVARGCNGRRAGCAVM
jgi:hypothetical protein